MANTKISSLATANAVTDTTMIPVVDGSTTKKVTGAQIKTHAQSGLATVATTGSYSDISNKPTIPDGTYGNLTGKPTLFSGSYADLTSKPSLITKATSISSIGTAVVLDTISVRYFSDGGYIVPQISSTSGSLNVSIFGRILYSSGSGGADVRAAIPTLTSFTYINTGFVSNNIIWEFVTVVDNTNSKIYRVQYMLQPSNTEQVITIEQL